MTKAPDGSGTGWGSHQPALRALAKFTEIKSVIEFGAGVYSTHLFLDRKAFPHLKSLVSLEHKEKWGEKVGVNDKRHTLIITDSGNFADRSKGMKADFVFLDSGPSFTARWELLEHASTLAPIIAIHDYRGDFVNEGFKYSKGFNSTIQTVFASNTVDLSGLELE